MPKPRHSGSGLEMAGPTTVPANGAAIPALGLGTWQLRGDDCSAAVKTALEAGYRHIDTAAMYDNEEAVGAGLKASGISRDEVFVTTKVWYEDLAPADLRRSAEASLNRLGLSRVDLLLIHWPNARIPLAGSVRALCEVKRAGLARHVGVANFTVRLLDEAVAAADEPIAANQCEYHPYLDQRAVLSACKPAWRRLHLLLPARQGAGARRAGDRGDRHGARPHAGANRAALASAAGRRGDPEIRKRPPHRRESRGVRFRARRSRDGADFRSRPRRRAHGGAVLVARLGLIHPPLRGGGSKRA